MFKISLAGLALLVGMMTGYSQSGFERKMDTTAIEKTPLKMATYLEV